MKDIKRENELESTINEHISNSVENFNKAQNSLIEALVNTLSQRIYNCIGNFNNLFKRIYTWNE